MKIEGTVIYSGQTYLDTEEDLEFDDLVFEGEGGIIIQYNQKISANTVMTNKPSGKFPQFTFTTVKPLINETRSGEIDDNNAAGLIINDLKSNIRVVNTGKRGGDGGRGGDGREGICVPPGSANGLGGFGAAGGNGGKGGDGGDGPDLIIKNESLNGISIEIEIKQAPGGKGGNGGKGGQGGKNADGSFAPNGADGADGENGKDGKKGRVKLNNKVI